MAYQKPTFAGGGPFGARTVKKKSPVEEVLATPAAVPDPAMAKPVAPVTQPLAVQPAPEVTPSGGITDVPTPPVVNQPVTQPPTTTGGKPRQTPPVETAPVGETRNYNGIEYFVPTIKFDPIEGISLEGETDPMTALVGTPMETELRLAATDAGLDPMRNMSGIVTAPRWVPRLQDTLSKYQAILASGQHDDNPQAKAAMQAEVTRLQNDINKGVDEYTRLVNALKARKAAVPNISDPSANLPPSGTGGTPGQDATGGTTPPAGGTPPVTQSTPFKEGELTKTPQQKLDDFLKTSPADHPGGIQGWMREREELRAAAKAGDATPAGSTAIGADEAIGSDPIANQTVDGFLKGLIENGYELSAEEEATIRRNVDTAVRQSLSSLSGRGLGRSSEAAGAIVQGEIAKEQQVGEAKARVRKEGTDAALRATELVQNAQNLNLNKTIADRNYQLAVAGHNLADLKNSQDVSFQDRAMQLKTMESKAAIAQMEKEFGLKIDELEWKKFIETGELNAKMLDITGTQRLNEIKIVNDYWLTKSDLELQERLGIDKLELQKWIAGEEFNIEKGAQALEKYFQQLDANIEFAKIRAALEAAGDEDALGIVLGFLSLGVNLIPGIGG